MAQRMMMGMPREIMAKIKLDLLRVVVSMVKQLEGLPAERRADLLRDLDLVITTGDLARLPPEIQINV